MTDRELLQQVLRFLQQVIAYSNEEMARLDALKKLVRDRLAQPEPEPVAWAEIGMDYVALSAKPFENAIPLYTAPVHAIDMSQERVDETAKRKHEPVAWIKNDELAYMSAVAGLGMTEWQTNLGLVHQLGDVPLYTTCPKNATTNGQEVAKSDETSECKTDPRAPHGFDRNASLSADRYVCECEGWEPLPNSELVDWEAVAADQAMTIAMMTLEQKREWVEIPYVSQHDSPVEYNIAEAVAWAVGYNQAIDNLKEKNNAA